MASNKSTVKEIQRLMSEIAFQLRILAPKNPDQTTAKENAAERLKCFQVVDIDALKVFE